MISTLCADIFQTRIDIYITQQGYAGYSRTRLPNHYLVILTMSSSAKQSQTEIHSAKATIGAALMAGGIVGTADQVTKMASKDDDGGNLALAALDAGAAIVGYEMLKNVNHHDAPDDHHDHSNDSHYRARHDRDRRHHSDRCEFPTRERVVDGGGEVIVNNGGTVVVPRGRRTECTHHGRRHRSVSVCSWESTTEKIANIRRRKHHGRHMLEEGLGLYGLIKEAIGDKRHHLLHLLEEGLGGFAMVKDLTSRK